MSHVHGPVPPGGGLLGILKPPGMTSHDVVALVRRRLAFKHIGHAGTLDPLASGVLPIVLGQATRLSDSLMTRPKSYRALIALGLSTTTGDLDGEPRERRAVPPTGGPGAGDVAPAVAGLVGAVVQVPPAYSARQVGGRRLYQLARDGQVTDNDLAAAARSIEVYSAHLVSLLEMDLPIFGRHPVAVVDIVCSGGTYVRQLAERVGECLGWPACLAFLVRTGAAGLSLDDCVTIEELSFPHTDSLDRRFPGRWRSPGAALWFLPAAVVGAPGRERAIHGLTLSPGEVIEWVDPPVTAKATLVRILDQDGRLVALAQADSALDRSPSLRPRRVFAPGADDAAGGQEGQGDAPD